MSGAVIDWNATGGEYEESCLDSKKGGAAAGLLMFVVRSKNLAVLPSLVLVTIENKRLPATSY